MGDDIFDTETFREDIKKVGPRCEFRYRCIFDPTPVIRHDRNPTLDADESN